MGQRITPANLSQRDRKDLARIVGKHGRGAVVEAIKTIPLPAKAGRPEYDKEDKYWVQDNVENAAWFILQYTELHRQNGSTDPQKDALKDLFEVIGDPEKWRGSIGFERFSQTQLRKTSVERRRLNTERERAEQLNAAWNRIKRRKRRRIIAANIRRLP